MLPEGGYLCFLDPSPKLPSALVANFVMRHYETSGAKNLNVVLIREKLSKLSEAVSLK